MPFHGTAGANDWVVVWVRIGTEPNGSPVVSSTPLEIECRVDKTSRLAYASDGTQIGITATMCGHEVSIPEGSAVWIGRIEDLPGTAQIPSKNVLQSVTDDATEDWRGVETYREAALTRWRDKVPVMGVSGD